MKNLPESVVRYLNKYGTDEREIEWNSIPVTSIVVIPAVKESKNIKKLTDSIKNLTLNDTSPTLFLFVINNTVSASEEVCKDNLETLKYLRMFAASETNINIGIIDASTKGKELNDKDGGVGLARKIGMDCSLKLFDYNSSLPKILICLDADCTVSANYITGINNYFNNRHCEAASIYFEHAPEPLSDAIICYEIFLRYYVAGLRFAESPYAFHTIGSSMACTAEAYIKAEGMNKKKAAEDFYFLEKLAKNTKICNINNVTVYPSQRGSWRVPFGTGQRVNRFINGEHDEYLLYNPEIFLILKEWLMLYNSTNFDSPDVLLKNAAGIHPELSSFLEKNNFVSQLENIKRSSRSESQLVKQKTKWFDGFRTLKLVHHLRDNGLPNIDMFQALNALFNLSHITLDFCSYEKVPPYEVRMKYLKKLCELDRLHPSFN